MWEDLCKALDPEHPPAMLKKDRFLADLKPALRWKVELKKPTNFGKAVEVAKNKEWKMQRMTQLGMSPLLVRPEVRLLESRVTKAPVSIVIPLIFLQTFDLNSLDFCINSIKKLIRLYYKV